MLLLEYLTTRDMKQEKVLFEGDHDALLPPGGETEHSSSHWAVGAFQNFPKEKD